MSLQTHHLLSPTNYCQHSLCIGLLLLAARAISEPAPAPPTLIMGHIEFPPHYYTDARGQARGHLIEQAHLLADRAGYRLVFRSYPTRRITQLLAEGKIDIILGQNTIASHAQKILTSGITVDRISLRAYSTQQLPPLKQKEDMQGKKILILNGYDYGGWAAYIKDPGNGIHYTTARDHQQALRILTSRDIDYLLDYKLSVEQALQKLPLQQRPSLYFNELFDLPARILVSKKTPGAREILEKFETAFRQLGDKNPTLHKHLAAPKIRRNRQNNNNR